LADVFVWSWRASDGYRWHYRHYPSSGRPWATVVGIHGIQSHGGWYESSCRFLRDAGCEVFFLDRRGSGLNTEARGDAPSFRRLLDDVREFLVTLRGPDRTPLFVVAISWGGKIGAGLCYRQPGLVDGLALLAPGFRPRVRPSAPEIRRIAVASVLDPTRLFPIPLNDPSLFTAQPRKREFIASDPLALRSATARFLAESLKFDVYLRRATRYVTIPVLLMLAGEDRIIDNAQTRQFVERFATQDRTAIEYPAAYHTLEFEPDPEPIFRDLLDWIRHRAGRP
jgi:alpha-beta hydrolase superfamily lysophospholipase